MNGLTFAALAEKNKERVEYFGHGTLENGWNEMGWGCAIAGEAGELCNILKKINRRASFDKPVEELRQEALREVADVVIYADLIAQKLGGNLADAVRDKFNEVSRKHGYPQTI